MPATTNRRLVLGALLVAAVAVIAFGNVRRFEFVYDDRWTIVDNRFLDVPLARVVRASLAGRANAEGVPDATRPAMIASMHLDRWIAGQAPAFYHLHSLALYGLASALASLVAFAVARDELVALLAGLAFALAPVHAEVVAAVNYREDLIAGVGVFSSLAWLFWPRTKTSAVAATAVAACWLWGLLGKESALALAPLVVSLAFVLRSGRDFWRSREVGLCVFVSVLIVWLNWRLALTLTGDGIPRAARAALSTTVYDTCRFMAGSVWAALFPFTVSPEYAAWLPAEPAWLLVPPALIAAVVVLGRRAETRAVAAGLCIAALGSIFASPLFRPINPWADRYLFVSVLGGSLAWAVVGARIARALPRAARAPLLVVACAAAAIVCNRSARVWANERALWTAAVAEAPRSPRAWTALSRVERLDGHLELADRDVARALDIDPGYAPARVTRAYNLLAHGDVLTARREIAWLDRIGEGEQPALVRARSCALESAADAPRCIRGRH